MADKSTKEIFYNILVEQLGVDLNDIKPESTFQSDLGADSLDSVELVMAVEEEFNIEVPDEEAEKIGPEGTVQQAIDLIDRLIKEQQ